MPEYRIDLLERFQAAFGFIAENAADVLLGNGYVVPQPYEEDEPVGFSKMGTAFFDQFIFEYKPDSGNSLTYKFEIPPMVDMSIAKRINVTTMNDVEVDGKIIGGGEVIESWGNESWEITLRGLLVDMDNHRRPKDQIKALIDFFKVNGVYQCSDSRVFLEPQITQIYLKSLSMPSLEGFPDTQPFVIQARSYVPAILEVTD